MVTVPATEFAKNFGRYRDMVQAEPVEVTSHDRVAGYFISKQDFEALQALKRDARPRAKPALSREERAQVIKALQESARRNAIPGPDAAHAADYLYDEYGLPK